MATGDKKVRPVLTVPQVSAVYELIAQCLDAESEQSMPDVLEVYNVFKLILFKENEGLLKGTGIVAPPRPTMNQKLGFTDSSDSSMSQESNAFVRQGRGSKSQTELDTLFATAPLLNSKQLAWHGKDNGTNLSDEDIDHLHTADSKYEWANDLYKGRIPPGKIRFNPDSQLYE